MGYVLCFVVIFSGFSAWSQTERGYSLWDKKKQDEKVRSRWTLAEWMEQKERNQWMDLWLARNSTSSPYEFFIEGAALNSKVTAGGAESNEDIYRGSLGAYAGVIGLRGVYEQDSQERKMWQGSLNLRVFGRVLQDTHINLEYGLQGLDFDASNEKFQNQYAGVSVNLYVTKYFGLSGSYQYIFKEKSNQDNELQGERSDAGVFLDFGGLRIFGKWRFEYLRMTPPPGGTGWKQSSEGLGGGLQLFF